MEMIGIAILVVLVLMGVIGMFGLPYRLWGLLWGDLGRGRGTARWTFALACVALVPAALMWGHCIYVGIMVMGDEEHLLWGGSEMGMNLFAFGILYVVFEILLTPFRRLRRRDATA